MARTWTIDCSGQRLWVTLRGRFVCEHARALDGELRDGVGRDRRELLVFLDELDQLAPDARYRLADVQRWVARARVRTAYVSHRPWFQGVALWIVHVAHDFNARGFATAAQAEHWFHTRDEAPGLHRTRDRRSLRLIQGGG